MHCCLCHNQGATLSCHSCATASATIATMVLPIVSQLCCHPCYHSNCSTACHVTHILPPSVAHTVCCPCCVLHLAPPMLCVILCHALCCHASVTHAAVMNRDLHNEVKLEFGALERDLGLQNEVK